MIETKLNYKPVISALQRAAAEMNGRRPLLMQSAMACRLVFDVGNEQISEMHGMKSLGEQAFEPFFDFIATTPFSQFLRYFRPPFKWLQSASRNGSGIPRLG